MYNDSKLHGVIIERDGVETIFRIGDRIRVRKPNVYWTSGPGRLRSFGPLVAFVAFGRRIERIDIYALEHDAPLVQLAEQAE